MGRPKDFPAHFQDLLVKYKSKGSADNEYKTYMVMAKVGWEFCIRTLSRWCKQQ